MIKSKSRRTSKRGSRAARASGRRSSMTRRPTASASSQKRHAFDKEPSEIFTI